MSEQPSELKPKKFILALSGGGFRATLFQLGGLKYLHSIGWLKNVTEIYSVSGGSVMAGFLATRWKELLDENSDFDEITKPLVKMIQSNVRNRVIWKNGFFFWLLPFGWRVTDHLQSEYKKLFGGNQSLPQLKLDFESKKVNAGDAFPEFHILACDLKSSSLCSFDNNGIAIWKDNSQEEERPSFESHSISIGTLPLAKAVAASSAFPPLFPPVKLTKFELQKGATDYQLTDGGVFDNLGLALPASAAISGESNPILLFDAETSLRLEADRDFRTPIPLQRNLRANEIVMRNLSKRSYADWGESFYSVEIRAELDKASLDPPLDEAVQRYVASIRTDLDTFSNAETNAIRLHGSNVARSVVERMAKDFNWEIDESHFKNSIPNVPLDQLRQLPFLFKLGRLFDFFRTGWFALTLLPILFLLLVTYVYSVGAEIDRFNQKISDFKNEIRQELADYATRGEHLKTIVPGCSIGLIDSTQPNTQVSFTLCCILRDKQGELFGLTAGHVGPKEAWGKATSLIVQPGPIHLTSPENRIGTLDRRLLEDQIDAGVFRLDKGVAWKNQVAGLGQITGLGKPVVGETVYVVDSVYGLLGMKVTRVNASVQLSELGAMDNLFEIEHFDSTKGQEPGGSSGGIVVNKQMQLIGMIMGRGPDGSRIRIATPIREALERLGLEIAETP